MRAVLFAAAILAAAVVGIVSLTGTAEAIPNRFYGFVTIDGNRAAGTVVTAEINDKDCSSPVQGSTFEGYNIDVNSDDITSGCGGVGSPIIFFKVGSRYASQIGCFMPGTFTELNLTISGAAQKPTPAPGQCGVSASPSPTPSASPSPTPTPSPSSDPSFSVSVLDTNSPCIPAAGSTICDATRQMLWTGSQAAWTARYEMMGRAAPTPDQVFDATIVLRVESGDPGAIAAIAQQLGWPHVRINAARYRGVTANELDEWVEVKNFGGGEQDMTNWSVRVEGTMIRWTFGDGFVLQPGQACKFYTGTPGADPCPGSSNVATSGVLPNSSGTITLWVDFLDLLAIRTSYNTDSNNQPPPPNLQGFS